MAEICVEMAETSGKMAEISGNVLPKMLFALSDRKTVRVHIDHMVHSLRSIEIGCHKKTLKTSISSSL